MNSRTRPALLLLVTALATISPGQAATPPTPPPPGNHAREVEAWREERLADLKEEGWLSLVGLFWLKEGENRFGSDPGNAVIFPEGRAPAVAGTFRRQGDAVTVEAVPGAGVTHAGKPVTSMALERDDEGEPTVLELGSLGFHVIKRGERVGIRVKDSKSPALAAFHGIDSFPVRPEWRVSARFEAYDPPKRVPVPNVLGDVNDTPSAGALVFERGGTTYRLDALGGSPDKALFLVFSDETNGKETYGAGRFLATGPVEDGKVVVDFNKAYNPPCAFTAFATCPLPPKQNHLALRVEAGEKKYGEGHP